MPHFQVTFLLYFVNSKLVITQPNVDILSETLAKPDNRVSNICLKQFFFFWGLCKDVETKKSKSN